MKIVLIAPNTMKPTAYFSEELSIARSGEIKSTKIMNIVDIKIAVINETMITEKFNSSLLNF